MSPSKALRSCTYPGCSELVRSGRCDKHKAITQRQQDERRGSASSRGYGRRWQQIRLLALSRQPLCCDCEQAGLIVAANEVHHIKALRNGGTHAMDNLLCLCHACHSKRTIKGE